MSTPSRSPARLLLDEHLARCERGEASDFEALCAAHPEHADELRRLEGLWPIFRGAVTEPASLFRSDSGDDAVAPGPWDVAEGRVLGDYRLVRCIGRGGMGEVWEAEQLSLSRRVALKLLLPDRVDERGVDFFAREARAGGKLSHPGIVAVYGSGETEGLHWIAMELVRESCDLRRSLDGCREGAKLGADHHRHTAEFVAELATTLQSAHDAGVIHRDLKPGNILVTMDDRPKLTDFGLAKLLDERSLSTVGDVAGTYCYMSPEQVALKHVGIDHRTDIFSLGVVLYEMLTLARPFEGDTSEQVARKILWEEPPAPQTIRSHTPRDLTIICAKAMEKEPKRRYQSMTEFAEDLRRHLRDQPILAKPSGPLVRVAKWSRRNPTKSVSAGISAAALVAISVLAWQLNLEKDQLAETNRQLATKTDEATGSAALATLRAEELEKTNSELDVQRRHAEDSRAEAASERDEAAQRAEELKQVSEFQARQLSGVDPMQMGLAIRSMVLDRAETSGVRTGREPRVLEEERAAIQELLAGVNFTGIALDVLDEQVFDGALRELESFENQPLVQGRLLQTVASTLRRLGFLDRATEPQVKAVEIFRRELGDEDLRTLISVNESGQLHQLKGELSAAESSMREVLKGMRRGLGDEHLSTLNSINNLNSLLLDQGKLDETEPLIHEVLETSRRTLGDSHRCTLSSINNLGMFWKAKGRLSEAEPLFREALKTFRSVYGDEYADTLASFNNLGLLLQDLRQWDEAEELFRTSIEGTRRFWGDEHPQTLTVLNNLSSALLDRAEFGEAESLMREVLEISRRTLGDEHPSTLSGINNLSAVLYAQAKFAEAEPLYREALSGLIRQFGDEHVEVLNSRGNLAALFFSQGKVAEAESLMRETLEGFRQALGEEHQSTMLWINNLAVVLESTGEWVEAESLFREVVGISSLLLGEGHPNTLKAQKSVDRVFAKRKAASDLQGKGEDR